MEFEDLQTFVKRRKEKKQREREERKQRKIDHYFKKIKKEKDVNENVVHYDGDDEEDGQNVLIVNPVQFGKCKAISTASNEAPGKFNGTSKELSVMPQALSNVPINEKTEMTTFQSDIDVTSSTEVVPNHDMTLMDQIQHAVVNIIPASEKVEEAQMDRTGLEQVHDSAVHTTEVQYHVATENNNSRPTVMEDVEAMQLAANATYSGSQTGVRDKYNQAENSAELPNLNNDDKRIATYATCHTQTMDINRSTNETQTDLVFLDHSGSQTEIENQDCIATQTDVTNCVEKECQTKKADVNSQEVQTEVKVFEEQIIQTEAVPKIDCECQTESEKYTQVDSESQTDLTNDNITTVDKIEIVQGMETFPTQTDSEELRQMSPFKRANEMNHGNMEGGNKSPEMDNTSESESNMSAVSKSDHKVAATVSAGLDMRVGAYKELSFPPVVSVSQKQMQMQPPVQERSPSPIDLCTKPSKDPNKEHETPKRKASTITVSHNPYDYYRPGKSRKLKDTRITPAHQSPVNMSATCSRHLAPAGFMSDSNAVVQRSAVANLHQTSVRDLSVKPSKNFQSRSVLHTPRPFTFKVGAKLETFANLTLKDRLLSRKISGITQKRRLHGRSGMIPKSTSQNVEMTNEPDKKKMKVEVSNIIQPAKLSTIRSQKSVNKLELYRQGLQRKEAEKKMLPTSENETSMGMEMTEDSSSLSDAAVVNKESVNSPRVLGLKKGCTFSKGVAPRCSIGLEGTQKEAVENIEMKKSSKPEKEKTVIVQLEKVDDRIDRELTEDLSGEQYKDTEKSNEASMKFKSSSDDDASLSFNDLENTQNTSAETATSSGKDADTDKGSTTCKSRTTKSSSSSSEEGDDSNSSNSESEGKGNGTGNASVPDSEDGDEEEYDDDNEEIASDKSQSTENSVHDYLEKNAKLDILRQKVHSPKSIASRIKDYSRKIGNEGVQFTISGPKPKYDTVLQAPRSDMKGFLSPRAKQEGFIPVAWNQGMVKSTMSAVAKQIPEDDGNIHNMSINEENITTDDIPIPQTPTDNLSLIDPSEVEQLPENIFSDSNPPVTSTPKTTKGRIGPQSDPASESITPMKKHSKPSIDGAGNGSSTDPYDETTTDKTQEMSGGDESNKPPKKAQKIADERFQEILKGTSSELN